ncbi:MAG: CHAT domain-containing protein [Bacteroidales bacterium]|nr:CHAT domain-containing protein [Bacteroidales bacterium]
MRLKTRIFYTILIIGFTQNTYLLCQDNISGEINSELYIADKYFNSLAYDSAEIYYFSALRNIETIGKWEVYCSASNKYIKTLWRQEKYKEAEASARKNLEVCLNHLEPNNPETGHTFLNLGILSFLTGHSGITDAYFYKSLDIFNRNYGEINLESAKVYEWLGIYHNGYSDSTSARKYLWEALRIHEQLNTTSQYLCADLYRYIGLFYKRYSEFDSALYYYRKAKNIFNKKYTEFNYKSIKCRNNIADVHEWFGRFDTALAIHKHSLELIEKSKAKNRYTLMMTYFNISEVYRNSGDFDNALKYMQKVLKLYYPEINDDSVLNNPENVEDFVCSVTKAALGYKASYLKEIYKKDPVINVDYLLYWFQCCELWNRLTEKMRRGITNIEELIFFEHGHNNTYIELAETAFLVYENTCDTVYLSKALSYLSINRNTNQIFSDKLLEKNFLDNVPVNYIKSKNLLQKELNEFLSQRLTIDKSDPTERINILIAEKKIELDILAYELVRDNPTLMNPVFNNKSIHYQTLVNKLKEGQALIWFHECYGPYLQTPDSIMIIALSDSDLKYFKIEGKVTVNLIKRYQKLISNDIYNIHKIDSVGNLLYSLLFDPVKNIISENNELIIIPSQHISMIPFDALAIAPALKPKRMIDCYSIWIEFSILSFLQDDIKSDNKKNNVLAFAPQFNKQQKETIALLTKRDTSLINLPGAILECENIATYFKTKIISGAGASRSAFEACCPGYQIIHLSTHAIPDKDNLSSIRLVFSDYSENNREGSMDLFEVLNLPVRANLVVLSACKTGVGEMSKGEGNINMAWAFNKAGARSVLVSLWDANDYASSVIMSKFYEYLSEGKTKPEALRQAKLDFIESSDELTHSPYFWAGFEYWGDDSTISTSQDKNLIFKIIPLIVLLIILAYLVKKRKPFFIDQ